MRLMKREEILHLASLARIRLTEEELSSFENELSSIVEYISAVKDIAGQADIQPELTPRYNVFRKDIITNEPNQYTEDLLKEMPDTEGRFLRVKKILQIDE